MLFSWFCFLLKYTSLLNSSLCLFLMSMIDRRKTVIEQYCHDCGPISMIYSWNNILHVYNVIYKLKSWGNNQSDISLTNKPKMATSTMCTVILLNRKLDVIWYEERDWRRFHILDTLVSDPHEICLFSANMFNV